MTMRKGMIEKEYGSMITHDGYVVSEYFNNPLRVTMDMNRSRSRAKRIIEHLFDEVL